MRAPRHSPPWFGFSLAAALATARLASADPVLVPDPTPLIEAESPAHVAAVCTWSPGPLNPSLSYLPQPPDFFTGFAWRIPADACPACGTGAPLEIQSVSFRVRWLAACSAQTTVSVVSSAVPTTGCSVPDPSQVLAGPVTTTISSASAGGVIYTVPLPAGNCVLGDAFVLVRFAGFGACTAALGGAALTTTTLPCVNCGEFYTTSATPLFSDWCPYVTGGNAIWTSVDAACCSVTPTLNRSWGSVKIRYR